MDARLKPIKNGEIMGKKLTEREEMVAVIRGGNSVIHNGTHYGKSNIDELPSDAYLAAGDSDKEAELAANLQAQLEETQAQLSALQKKAGHVAPAPATAPVEKGEAGAPEKKSADKK